MRKSHTNWQSIGQSMKLARRPYNIKNDQGLTNFERVPNPMQRLLRLSQQQEETELSINKYVEWRV